MNRSAFFLVVLSGVFGCGGGLEEFPTAKVVGKVLCDGHPVPDVLAIFAPVGGQGKSLVGKSGQGIAGQDGSFIVSTYGTNDGAVVGKHTVIVLPPHPEDFPDFNCDCETDGKKAVMEVVVTADGENNFTINLPAKADKTRSNIRKKDLDDISNAAPANDVSNPVAGK